VTKVITEKIFSLRFVWQISRFDDFGPDDDVRVKREKVQMFGQTRPSSAVEQYATSPSSVDGTSRSRTVKVVVLSFLMFVLVAGAAIIAWLVAYDDIRIGKALILCFTSSSA